MAETTTSGYGFNIMTLDEFYAALAATREKVDWHDHYGAIRARAKNFPGPCLCPIETVYVLQAGISGWDSPGYMMAGRCLGLTDLEICTIVKAADLRSLDKFYRRIRRRMLRATGLRGGYLRKALRFLRRVLWPRTGWSS